VAYKTVIQEFVSKMTFDVASPQRVRKDLEKRKKIAVKSEEQTNKEINAAHDKHRRKKDSLEAKRDKEKARLRQKAAREILKIENEIEGKRKRAKSAGQKRAINSQGKLRKKGIGDQLTSDIRKVTDDYRNSLLRATQARNIETKSAKKLDNAEDKLTRQIEKEVAQRKAQRSRQFSNSVTGIASAAGGVRSGTAGLLALASVGGTIAASIGGQLAFGAGMLGLDRQIELRRAQVGLRSALGSTGLSGQGLETEKDKVEQDIYSRVNAVGGHAPTGIMAAADIIATTGGLVSNSVIQDLVVGLTSAGVTSGADQGAIERSFLGLKQLMSGAADSENVKQVTENMPSLVPLIAKAMGVDQKVLLQKMKDGDLNEIFDPKKFAEVFAAELVSKSSRDQAQLEKESPLIFNINKAAQAFNQALLIFSKGKEGGVISFLNKMTTILNENHSLFLAAGKTVGTLIDAIGYFINQLVDEYGQDLLLFFQEFNDKSLDLDKEFSKIIAAVNDFIGAIQLLAKFWIAASIVQAVANIGKFILGIKALTLLFLGLGGWKMAAAILGIIAIGSFLYWLFQTISDMAGLDAKITDPNDRDENGNNANDRRRMANGAVATSKTGMKASKESSIVSDFMTNNGGTTIIFNTEGNMDYDASQHLTSRFSS
jgi:tape measure domain-containing protein